MKTKKDTSSRVAGQRKQTNECAAEQRCLVNLDCEQSFSFPVLKESLNVNK